MERKRRYFQTSLTENTCAPDAAKKSILPNVVLRVQEEQQPHLNRAGGGFISYGDRGKPSLLGDDFGFNNFFG